MINKEQQFFKKINNLSEEIQYYYESKVISEIIKELSNKYKIDNNIVIGLIVEYTINDFDLVVIEKEINYIISNSEEQKRFILDFIGYIFLPIDFYLEKKEIKKEIQKRNGNLNEYIKYINLVKNAIEDKRNKFLEELTNKYDELIDLKEESEISFDIFNNKLFDILKDSTRDPVIILNSGLIYLLFNVDSFQEEIKRVLLSNQEKLTQKNFTLNEKPTRPTIENWIKDFIKFHGSAIFDNIVLSKYISNSSNVKLLDPEEKRLVKKLLKLYRNLIFFPESLKDIPVERWEIFPIERDTIDEKVRPEKISMPKTSDEKRIEEVEEMLETGLDDDLEKKVLKEELEKRKRIAELRFTMSKYREGSLERRVLEEEIEKLEK